MTGRQGRNSLVTSAEKVLMKMKNTADNVKVRKLSPEKKATACSEALRHCKDRNLNREICAEALAHYMTRKRSLGRSGGGATAWDELYGELSESLTTDQIMEQLDLWNPASLGLLIDNTGSMADDIDQVQFHNSIDISSYAVPLLLRFSFHSMRCEGGDIYSYMYRA